MKRFPVLAASAFLLYCHGASPAETNAPAHGKVVAIVNAADVPSEMLAQLKQLAGKSMKVAFETSTVARVDTTNLLAAGVEGSRYCKDNYAAMVILVAAPTSFTVHASFNTNTMTSVINVTAMAAANGDLYRSRVLKQVVRGTAFAFGLKPSKDPLCATRDYRTLAELDKMPPVLFPPWQHAFEKLAVTRGLRIDRPVPRKPPVTPPAPKAP
jgi:predicted Zn-dependent protease